MSNVAPKLFMTSETQYAMWFISIIQKPSTNVKTVNIKYEQPKKQSKETKGNML